MYVGITMYVPIMYICSNVNILKRASIISYCCTYDPSESVCKLRRVNLCSKRDPPSWTMGSDPWADLRVFFSSGIPHTSGVSVAYTDEQKVLHQRIAVCVQYPMHHAHSKLLTRLRIQILLHRPATFQQ